MTFFDDQQIFIPKKRYFINTKYENPNNQN